MNFIDYYIYGMKARPCNIGCQPMEGLVTHKIYEAKEILTAEERDKFHDILLYDRRLSDKEQYDYELQYLGIWEVEE